MLTIATICARGGSVGVPGKNIRPLLGKPLIVHTIEHAKAVPQFYGIYVSTDYQEIADVAVKAGAIVPFLRPEELATNQAPKIPVIEHLVQHIERDCGHPVDTVVDLDPTSPLRDVRDIIACMEMLDENTDVVITGYEAEKNPYFNMVELGADGYVGRVKTIEDGSIDSRQQAPKVYSMNASIYVWRRSCLSKGLWGNRIKLYEMPRERSVDIDEPIDFQLVEILMKQKIDAART